MTLPAFDLQSHSTYSDGELAPDQVVRAAHTAGVELLALTDHDSVGGIAEAAATAEELGIRLITAVEMTTIDGGVEDLHVCAYGIDPGNQALQDQLRRSSEDRDRRAQSMLDALTEDGWLIDEQLLASHRADGGVVGRPHIAKAVVARSGNAARLAQEGLSDPTAFLVAYLIEGKPAFRPRHAPSVEEAITVIHGAGGVAVWAHPFWDIGDAAQVLSAAERFRDSGLDGIEAFYLTHTREQVELLAAFCNEHGLMSTGSSDFHGPNHRQFNRFLAFETYGLEPDLGPLRD